MHQVMSFGDIIRPGAYALHSRFSRAVNFIGGGRLVSVVDPSIGGGPINIVLAGADFGRLGSLQVQEDSFLLDGASLPKSPLFDSRLPAPGTSLDLRRCRDLLLRKAHPKSLAFLLDDSRSRGFTSGFEKALVQRLQTAAHELRDGDLEAGSRSARGAGLGLTPSGDDLLSGYLWGLHFRQRISGGDLSAEIKRVYASAKSTNPLSSAFLGCALEGRFFQRLRDLLADLGDPERIEGRLDGLLSVGETSGADTCVGLMLALEKEDSLWS